MDELQRVLDLLSYGRRWLSETIALFAMRIYGLEIDRATIRAGCYKAHRAVNLNLDDARDAEGLLLLSQECARESAARLEVNSEKCKSLVGMSAVVTAAFGLSLPKSYALLPTASVILFMVGATLMSLVIVLVLESIAVRQRAVLSLDQDVVALEANELRKHLVNANIHVRVAADNRADYCADVFSVARMYFLCGVVVMLAGLTVTHLRSGALDLGRPDGVTPASDSEVSVPQVESK